MSRSQSKIWFKRTFANGDRGGHLKLTKEEVYNIRKAQELNKSKGYPPMFSLQEARFWYAPYRYVLDNKKHIWALVLVIIGALLTYFLGARK